MENKKINIHDIHAWWNKAYSAGLQTEKDLLDKEPNHFIDLIYPDSVNSFEDIVFVLAKTGASRALIIFNENSCGFFGHFYKAGKNKMWFCQTDHQNAVLLRKLFPFTAPSSLKNEELTFGMGDRLDFASPGHLRTIKEYNAAPVLAQQSVRELTLTGRTYAEAIDSATWAVFQEGYRKPWGADGDHLKTPEMVREALGVGTTMITADISDYIRDEYAAADSTAVREAYNELDDYYRKRIERKYLENGYRFDTNEEFRFSAENLARIALIYKEALDFAGVLFTAGREVKSDFDFEVSIDETETPTSPQAHIFVQGELKNASIEFVSLAPRFIGEFQKGIDYIGDTLEFEKAFRTHAAIARYSGGYKISVHSGSDKFSVFPIIGKETLGHFHIKTSGTSWLEALRVVAEASPELFRRLYTFAVDVFPITSSHYYVTPDFNKLYGIDNRSDNELAEALDNPHDRRILHIAYGEIFKNESMKEELHTVLQENTERYYDILMKHFHKHLEKLGAKRKQ